MIRKIQIIALILCFIFQLSCFGGGDDGGSNGSGIGPLVDASGDFSDGPGIGDPGANTFICNDLGDERLKLSVSQVLNPQTVISGDQFNPDNPLAVYSGIEHDYFGGGAENQTRIQWEITAIEDNVTLPGGIQIDFVFLSDVEENPDGPWPLVTSFFEGSGIDIINPICQQQGGSCLGSYADPLGIFDMVPAIEGGIPGIPQGWPNWNDEIMVAQVCGATIDVPGEGIIGPVSSNPAFFVVIPEMSP